MNILTFVIALVFCLQSTVFATKNKAQEVTSHFSDKEKAALSLFFEEAVAHDSFGHTIFGKKPVSYIGFFEVPQYTGPSWLIRDHIALHEGAKLCHKLNSYLSECNFALKFQHDPQYQQSFVYLINKKEFINVIQAHLTLFQETLGKSVSPQGLLENILKTDTKVEEVLKGNEALQGIIFGFGEKNSWMFNRMNQLRQDMSSQYYPPSKPPSSEIRTLFYLDHKLPNSNAPKLKPHEMTTIINEYTELQRDSRNAPKKTRDFLTMISLPSFVGDMNCNETIALLDQYNQTRTTINQAYSNQNFLEVTLCKMLEG